MPNNFGKMWHLGFKCPRESDANISFFADPKSIQSFFDSAKRNLLRVNLLCRSSFWRTWDSELLDRSKCFKMTEMCLGCYWRHQSSVRQSLDRHTKRNYIQKWYPGVPEYLSERGIFFYGSGRVAGLRIFFT